MASSKLNGVVIARLAHSYGVRTIAVLGRYTVDLVRHLPPFIQLIHLPVTARNSSSLRNGSNLGIPIEFENTLVIAEDLAEQVGVPLAIEVLSHLTSCARAIVATDNLIAFAGPEHGWLEGATPWSPFGLRLPFSLVDTGLDIQIPANPLINAVAILTVFNEQDIVETCIHKLTEAGVAVHVMDNWSTDGTYQTLSRLADAGQIVLERFPAVDPGPSGSFELAKQLARKEQIALHHPGSWIIHLDADEVRRSPWPDLSLKQSLWLAEAYGSNTIDFTVINFRPVDDTWTEGSDPETHFRWFEFGEARDAYNRQVKAWKQGERRVSLAESAGHEVRFPGARRFPYNWLLKHYPLRSAEHIQRKLFSERLPRFSAAERQIGWHTHYDRFADMARLQWSEQNLCDALLLYDRYNTSLVTGVPPEAAAVNEELPAEATLTYRAPVVWLALSACVVIDVPEDEVGSVYARLRTERLVHLTTSAIERVEFLAANSSSRDLLDQLGVRAQLLDVAAYVDGRPGPSARSFAAARELAKDPRDLIFFAETGGLLDAALSLKRQGLFFQKTRFVCVLSGGLAEKLRNEGSDLREVDHVEQDLLEYRSVLHADDVVATDPPLAEAWIARGIPSYKIDVLDTLTDARGRMPTRLRASRVAELVYLGSLQGSQFEAFVTAMDAVGRANPGMKVTFAGPFGLVTGEHAGGFLLRKAKSLAFEIDIIQPSNVQALLRYLDRPACTAVLPGPDAHRALLAPLLAERGLPTLMLTATDTQDIARSLRALIEGRLQEQSVSVAPTRELAPLSLWLSGLAGKTLTERGFSESLRQPLVTVGIPHFDRPDVLISCLKAIANQTYPALEIIVVDDGSRQPVNQQLLRDIEILLERMSGRIIYQDNAYLGAARNTVADHAQGEYIFFIDDDDYPLPHQIEYLTRAAERTGADVVSSAVAFWDGGEVPVDPGTLRAGNFPVGGDAQLPFWKQSLGAACILVRRTSFDAIGRYTTDYGVGWEDYEFAYRTVLAGFKYEAVPLPLYLYRVDGEGMAATTPTLVNGARLWRTIEAYTTHPAMQSVLRMIFAKRIWEEAKNNRLAFLYGQGNATRIYYNLLRDPPNSPTAVQHLVELAVMEGQIGLAERLRSIGVRSDDIDDRIDTNVKRLSSPQRWQDRFLRVAVGLDELGAGDVALKLLQSGSVSISTADRTALLTSAFLYMKHGRYSDALPYVEELLIRRADDLEALVALRGIMEFVSDEHAVGIADGMINQEILRTLGLPQEQSRFEYVNAFPSAFPSQNLAAQATYSESFEVFPSNTIEMRVKRLRGSWDTATLDCSRTYVDHPSLCRYIVDERALYVHPRMKAGDVAFISLPCQNRDELTGIYACLRVHGIEAIAAEIAIIGFADILDMKSIVTIFDRRDDVRDTNGVTTILDWRSVCGNSNYVLHFEFGSKIVNTVAIAIRTLQYTQPYQYPQFIFSNIAVRTSL